MVNYEYIKRNIVIKNNKTKTLTVLFLWMFNTLIYWFFEKIGVLYYDFVG